MTDPASPDPGTAAGLHSLLLRLAGRVPDDVLTALRERLVAERPAGFAATLRAALLAHDVALSRADLALLAAVAPDPARTGAVRRASGDPAPPYAFVAVPSGPAWFGPPLLLDLTTVHAGLATVAADDVDAAAVAAAGAEPAGVALWRAWRLPLAGDPAGPPTRVYLLEVDRPAAELPAVTARVQQALAGAELPHPQVEVYHPELELPTYQRLARAHAALLWTAVPGGPVEIARVFDRVDPLTGPLFDPGHERLTDPGERDRVLDYLRRGAPLLVTTAQEPDFHDPTRPVVVPVSFRTDGRWIWTDAVGYYLRTYELAPDPELVASIRRAGYRMPAVDAVAMHRALVALQEPIDELPGGS